MGGAGSPAAIETADVVLMGDDLRKIGGFLALAKASQGIVRQNIAFLLGTKAIAAVFALAGLLPLWLAVLTDVERHPSGRCKRSTSASYTAGSTD